MYKFVELAFVLVCVLHSFVTTIGYFKCKVGQDLDLKTILKWLYRGYNLLFIINGKVVHG